MPYRALPASFTPWLLRGYSETLVHRKQETDSPQDGREEDLLEPLHRNRSALLFRPKDRAMQGDVQKGGQFIAGGRRRHTFAGTQALPLREIHPILGEPFVGPGFAA